MSDFPAFGRLLLDYRKAAKLTQAQLARTSGVSIRALRDLEHGRAHAAQRRSAELLADALRLTGDDRSVFLTVAKEGRRRTPANGQARALCALPPAAADFTGRDRELAALRAGITGDGGVVAIVGHPGVGKTSLAVAAAHQLRADYPDGCFAVDLRGVDDQAVPARVVLDRLLRALDVAPTHIPAAEAEQSGLFRALLDGRRVLLLLDNAADETQVRPLLATGPGCLTLVTARRTLAGLEAAHWLRLDPLAGPDAVALLARIAGDGRVAAEPAAATDLVTLCGNLPLAVRIAGNRLASRPHWSVTYLAEQLRDERTRLGSLTAGDLQVRSAFEISYRRLTPAAQRVFRRLAAVPGADFGVELAAVATELTAAEVPAYLDELVDAGLLQPAAAPARFGSHDLIRIFAAELWRLEEPAADRDRLRDAVLDHLLDRAIAAGRAQFPDAPQRPGRSADTAVDWLVQEGSNWSAAQREAARLGRHRDVIELAKAMHWYSDSHHNERPWDEVFALGVASARVLDSRADLALLLNFLGWAQVHCLQDYHAALDSHQGALAVALRCGELTEEAWAHGYLADVLTRLGELDQALPHARQACELGVDLGFWTIQVALRIRLSRTLRAVGRADEAFAVTAAVLADMPRYQEEGNAQTRRWERACILAESGHTLSGLGRWRRAAQTYQDARLLFAELGSATPLAADTALHEGRAWRVAGEFDRARECLELALAGFTGPAQRTQAEAVRAELDLLPGTAAAGIPDR